MKFLLYSILITFDILSLISMSKLNKYKNQKVSNLIPVQALTATSPYYCLAMYSKYCTSTLMADGIDACEIVKSTSGYICNYYGSSFTVNLLSSRPISNVYVKRKGNFFIVKYSEIKLMVYIYLTFVYFCNILEVNSTKSLKRCMLPAGNEFVYWDTYTLLSYYNLSFSTRLLYNNSCN